MPSLLLDTHVLIWFLRDEPALSKTARAAIIEAEADVFVSAATVWEIATKVRLGKLPAANLATPTMGAMLEERGFRGLPISMEHAQHSGSMQGEHKDPFDRMLAAQALLEGLLLVSNERAFDTFGVKRLW